MSENNDGFIQVKSKKKQRKKFKNSNQLCENMNINPDPVDVDELILRINNLKSQLISHDYELYVSKFLFNLDNILSNHFSKFSIEKINVLCFGLGSFEENLSSRYQLALLLIIVDRLKEQAEVVIKEFFDPLFNSIDKHVLEKILDYKYSDINSKCLQKIEINSNCLTLAFMPHCPKALYNNFLFANWRKAHLESILIVGNSFRTMQSLNNDENFAKNYRYLNESLKFHHENKIESNCDLTNAFYDLSFVMFRPNQIEKLSIDFYHEDFDLKSLLDPIYDINEDLIIN